MKFVQNIHDVQNTQKYIVQNTKNNIDKEENKVYNGCNNITKNIRKSIRRKIK